MYAFLRNDQRLRARFYQHRFRFRQRWQNTATHSIHCSRVTADQQNPSSANAAGCLGLKDSGDLLGSRNVSCLLVQ